MGTTGKTGYLKQVITGILGLLIVIVALLALFRTTSLEFAGKLVLNSLGFENVRLSIDQVSLGKIHISALSLADAIRVQDISAQYDLISLLKGELNELEIGMLAVNFSNPQDGAINDLIQLMKAPEKEPKDDNPLILPSITLKQGRIYSDTEGRTLQAEISGTVSPRMILQGNALVSGSMETGAGPVLLENLQLSIHADMATQTAELEIEGGILRHGSETPDWTTLSLSGAGSLANEMAELKLGVQTTSGQSLFQFFGRYNIMAKTGSAKLMIPELEFNRQGLQPEDLTRYAKALPPFDGVLSTDVNLALEGSTLIYDLGIEMTGLVLEQSGAVVTADRIPLKVSGTYSLENGTQKAGLSLPDTEVLVAYDKQNYWLKKLSVKLGTDNFGDTIELKSFTGSAVQVGKNQEFTPLIFRGSGKTGPDGDFRLEGVIFDAEERLTLNVTAHQSLKTRDGSLSLELRPVKIGGEALRPAKISTYLKDFPTDLSGTITGVAEFSQGSDTNVQLVSASAEISKAAFTQNGAQLSGLSLQATAAQQQPDGLIKGDIIGQINTVSLSGQSISVPDLLIKFQMPIGTDGSIEAGKMALENMDIEPGNGALFKESLTVTGAALLKKEEINFSTAITSDLIGSFAKIKGRHSLKSGTGSAQIDTSTLVFEKGILQPSDLVVLPDPIPILNGSIDPVATIDWSSKGMTGKARVNVVNLSVKADSGEISELNGTINIDELFPLTISEPQELKATQAVAGISLKQPELLFRVLTKNGFPVLYIDRMAVGVVGGSAIIDRATIDTGAEVNKMTVQLSSLNLEEVMDLGNVEELYATGSVSGKIPLIFGGNKLLVDTGVLTSDGPGVLKMKSEAARQALAGGGDQTTLLLDILENFQYSELSLKIAKTETGEDTVMLHASGANPDIENNRPVILNINLTTSLDKILNAVLDGYLLSEKALRATVEGRK